MSVLVTVFNGGVHLRQALDSVLAQDYESLEILVADDGSTDGSREICRSYARMDARVRLIENASRLGMVGNYNQLIALASGQYVLFADQDDCREPSFVSRCAEILNTDERCVLCHSHTAVVWPGMTGALYHVNTLNSVDGVADLWRRYWRFLRHYSDTAIYALIRLEALRRTGGWRRGLGSSNRLLFELLMQGPFRQVGEVLYQYTAKGLRDRPSPAEEYARQTAGRRMPALYVPFLAVAAGQSRDIISSGCALHQKITLLGVLWLHVALVNVSKAVYRFLWRVSGGRVPGAVHRICARLVYSTTDLQFVIAPEEDSEYYPEGWPLRAE